MLTFGPKCGVKKGIHVPSQTAAVLHEEPNKVIYLPSWACWNLSLVYLLDWVKRRVFPESHGTPIFIEPKPWHSGLMFPEPYVLGTASKDRGLAVNSGLERYRCRWSLQKSKR